MGNQHFGLLAPSWLPKACKLIQHTCKRVQDEASKAQAEAIKAPLQPNKPKQARTLTNTHYLSEDACKMPLPSQQNEAKAYCNMHLY